MRRAGFRFRARRENTLGLGVNADGELLPSGAVTQQTNIGPRLGIDKAAQAAIRADVQHFSNPRMSLEANKTFFPSLLRVFWQSERTKMQKTGRSVQSKSQVSFQGSNPQTEAFRPETNPNCVSLRKRARPLP